jgi:alkylhydroperoxidase/carboxymuconolactone decarboxylase family protein YurZ
MQYDVTLRRTGRGGNAMREHPLKTLEKLDPKLVSMVEEMRDFAYREGALPKKYKFLIALAIMTSHLADEGIKTFAEAAMQAGATKDEIAETLRLAYYHSGASGIFTANHALKELL